MKNLKRVLSLALATVMLFGMMVVGANASFADQTDIKYAEAVDYMVGLGVIQGMGNNQFQPNGTLTRAQAARLVAMVKAGANENTISYYEGNTKFKDVGANYSWANGSINYCVANGIISGETATTYNPGGNLTGVALAKMLLVALGYPATSEKDSETLVGPNWQVNTMRKATAAGLFKGLDSSFAAVKTITRQEAAQIMFNALGAFTVEVSTWDMYGNPQYHVTTTKLLSACFDVQELTGIVTGNAASGAKGTVVSFDTDNDGVYDDDSKTFEFETGIDMLGHKVTAVAKQDNNGLVRNKTTNNVEVYGIIDEASMAETIVASGAPSTVTGADGLKKDLETAGFDVSSVSVSDMYQNYNGLNAAPASYSVAAKYTAGKTYVAISNNDQKQVSMVIEVVSYLNKVAGVTNTGTGSNAKTTYSFAVSAPIASAVNTTTTKAANVYDGIAKDDYVVITKVGASFYNVEKANTVTATVSQLKKTGAALTGVVAGGTTYSASGVDTSNAISGVNTFANSALGECVLLLDNAGKLMGTTGVAAAANYAYVAKIAEVSSTNADGMVVDAYRAMVYFADGSKGAYDIDVANSDVDGDGAKGEAGDVSDSSPAGLYSVIVNGDNTVSVDKKLVTDNAQAGVTKITKGVSKVTGAAAYTDADTVAFFVTGSYDGGNLSVHIYKGTANIPTVSSDITTATKKTVGTNSVLNAVLISAAPAEVSSDVYFYNGGFALGNRVENGRTISTVTYTVFKDGAETTLTFDKSAAFSTTAAFVKVKSDATDLEAANPTSITGPETATDNDKATGAVAFNSFFEDMLTVNVTGNTSNTLSFKTTGDTQVVCLLPDGAVYTLTDLANTGIISAAEVYVSYTVDAVGVRTATAVYVTSVTLAP